ncbi:MAG: tetratricopeptide repeat protein [Pirellulales bacterium]|nr:tetratricopeptide repeat protein [Pirellulales bacterium]
MGRMMLKRFIIPLLLALSISLRLVSAEELRVGAEVVIIQAGELWDQKVKTDKVWPGLVLRVLAIKDGKLYLKHHKHGWLNQTQAIPLNRAAIDTLANLIKINPTEAKLFQGRGEVWLSLGEQDNALADFNEAIRLKLTADSFHSRGLVWLHKGEFNKAIADFTEALTLNPTNAGIFVNRGNAWSELRQYDKAIKDFSKAIKLDPRDFSAFHNRAITWNTVKEYGRAISDYREAIRLAPQQSLSYGSLARIYATCDEDKHRDGKLAVALAIKACELSDWKDDNELENLSVAYAEYGDFPQALEYLEQANQLNSTANKGMRENMREAFNKGHAYRDVRK